MMTVSKVCKPLIIASLAVAGYACAGDKSELLSAADQYCSFYNPSSWGDLAESGDTYSIFNLIVSKQETEIKSSDFKAIISSADTTDFAAYHSGVKANIGKAIGKEWVCEDFDQFFMPSQTVVSLTLSGVQKKSIDPNADNTIVIAIAHSGEILIGNAPLKSNDQKSVLAGIKSKIAGRDINKLEFVLYFDEGANGNLVPRLLASLSELGVTNVGLIDY